MPYSRITVRESVDCAERNVLERGLNEETKTGGEYWLTSRKGQLCKTRPTVAATLSSVQTRIFKKNKI